MTTLILTPSTARFPRALLMLPAALILLPLIVTGQTLTITNGVQTYGALTNTTVTMTSRCELRVTATSSPIPGCIIHLNSADSYFALPNIKPSTLVASYLGQVRVNGAVAVVDSNCRVVEYGMGAVVVPHAPSFQPLTVFTGPHFTGASMPLGQYVYYKSSLGSMYANISSFKLKRGYMATFAQSESGTGISKCYVAQDGDMEISLLPDEFDDSIRFIYVLPWRWTSKKSIAGDPGISQLNVKSWYNWNIDQNSSRDLEYVAIRATRWWPSLTQNWQTRGINTVLGYNEPDSAEQANIAVADAIWSWPDLLATGLRIGSPAPTDGGYSSWLYPFIAQADAANLRVDFTAVHYYRCASPVSDPNAAANQMYNALKGIYDTTKRPIWITEWNNGANWTGCGDPSYAQQQAAIAAMIDMLDSTPWVERYQLYSWVEEVRQVTTNNVLTPSGITYRDQQSPIGYVQALQGNGTRSFTQLRFETNTLDTSGHGNNGITTGSPAYTNGHNGQALVFDGTNTLVTLPPNVATGSAFTFAAWVNWGGGANWQRAFDFGNSTTHYMFLTPSSGSGTLRFAIKNGGSEQIVETSGLPTNQWRHVAVTLSGNTARIYTNGVLAASNTGMTITPASFAPRVNTLGRAQFVADPLFKGLLDDVLITDYALSAAQITALQTSSPPQFTNSIFARPSATEGLPYSNTIAGAATDADAGDTLTYSKTTGPAWLSVAADGTLTGTPTSADGGTNYFTVRVTDPSGQNGFALLTILNTVSTLSGVWTADASASWSETNRWSGGAVASGVGQTADFSTINITGNRTVTLDSSRSIGTLKFGDFSGTQAWTVTNNGITVLSLNTGTATQPALVVTNTATISAPLAGTNGFVKSGPGTLILSGNNSFSGTLNVDTSSTTLSDGIVRVAGPGALGGATLIQIRNNNSGTSTLQFDGTLGGINASADIALNGRNSAALPIQNLAGTNTVSGTLNINVGGGNYLIQSDAGLLNWSGTISSVAIGTRTFTFQGNGDHAVTGIITNGSATTVNVTKTGAGKLTLAGNNTYTGLTTVSGGTLEIGNGGVTGTLGTNGVVNNGVLVFNRSNAVSYLAPISGSGSLRKLGAGTLTISNANTYSGGTTLSNGVIQADHSSALGTAGTISCNTGTNAGRLILGNGVTISRPLTAASVNAGAGSLGLVMVNDNTSATYGGSLTFNASATTGGHFAGPTTSGLLTVNGTVTASAGNALVIRAGNVRFSGGGTYGEIQVRANTTSLGAHNGISTSAVMDIGGNGSTDTATLFNLNGFNQTLAGLKDAVTPGNAARVTNSSPSAVTLTLNLGATNHSFGGSIMGNVALVLNSGEQTLTKSGTTALNGLYTYTGNTTLNGGTLVLGADISLPNTPVITVGAGTTLDVIAGGLTIGPAKTLQGSGLIFGAVNAAAGSTIKPGSSIGTLTVADNLLLGGTVIMELDRTNAQTSDMLVGGPIIGGGVLSVQNIGPVLQVGDTFQLFPSAVSGFSSVVLPSVDGSGAVYAWENRVAIDGSIKVVGVTERIYAVTKDDNQLISFGSTTPGTILSAVFLSGLEPLEQIVGIDFQGDTLYGVGSFSRLYTLNRADGAATFVGAFTPGLSGLNFGVDAEPAGLRIVSDQEQNLLLDFVTGTATEGVALNGPTNLNIAGLARHPGTGQYYVADYFQNTFGTLDLTTGLVNLIGPAGIDFSRYNGFDISGRDSTAYLASPAASSDPAANLYTIDLGTGATSLVGLIGNAGDDILIRGLAVGPAFSTAAAVAQNPTNITFSASGGSLTLSWPNDYIGWRLQTQTNSRATGLSTNWFDVPGSSATNNVSLPVDVSNGTVFYRLIYP